MQLLIFISVLLTVMRPIFCAYENSIQKESGKSLNKVDSDEDKIHHSYGKTKENLGSKSAIKEPLYLTSISFINGSYKPVRFARPYEVQRPPVPVMTGVKHEMTPLKSSHDIESTAAEIKDGPTEDSTADPDVVLDLDHSAPQKKGKQAFIRLATFYLNGTKTEEEVPLEDSSDEDGQ